MRVTPRRRRGGRPSSQKGVTRVGNFGWQELLIIFVILLLLFGATRLPALSRSLGQSIRGFKKGLQDDDETPADTGKTAPAPDDDDKA